MPTRHPRPLDPSDSFETALSLHRQGRLREAEELYRAILKAAPGRADALHYLGVVRAQQGRLNEAIHLIRRSVEKEPGSAEAHNDLGVALEAAKRPGDAIPIYERALALRPDYFEASFNLGNALQALKRHDAAIARFGDVISGKSNHAAAHNNLGLSLSALGRNQEAVAHFESAITYDARYAEAHYNLANALKALDRDREAISQFAAALAIRPDYFEAHNNLAILFVAKSRHAEALEHYQKAASLRPDDPGVHFNLGRVLRLLLRVEDAFRSFERAVALKPDYAEAHYILGGMKWERGMREAAVSHWRKALGLEPDFASARLALCLAELPILYRSQAEVMRQRKTYERALRQLCADVENGSLVGDLVSAVGTILPFYLAYQGFNDRELQSLWGGLVRKAVVARFPDAVMPARPAPTERIRIGFVSGFFYRHTVWKLMIRGWLGQLDRRRFEVFGYHTKGERSAETDLAAKLCDRFVTGPLSTDRWREEVLRDKPHVLIYPEIGMDGTSVLLAAQRLAPVQCVSWGHPDTTGLATIDYFLTSDLMEPSDGESHYTERLVRLPNLSIYYEPPELEPVTIQRGQLGLRSDAVAFWCGQSVFKYLPQYDDIYPRIARDLGNCQFVFIRFLSGGAELTKAFRKRLEDAFSSFGLRAAEHCVFLDKLSQSEFVAAIGLCDVYLDSIGWSGGNTTLESLQQALPIVTTRGPLMRGRHSSAILERMGVTDTICSTIDEYVQIALRLGRDTAWRREIQDRIRRQRHLVYRDKASIASLEEFLEKATHGLLGPVPPDARDQS